MQALALLALALVAPSVTSASSASPLRPLSVTSASCPDIEPVANLDLNQWVAKTWYVQKQQVTPYQEESQLYCVTATYNLQEPQPSRANFIDVANYGNNNEVNGPTNSVEAAALCAKQTSGGELAVAPCVLSLQPFLGLGIFDLVAGPYWVLAVAEDYSWAIVSGGAPTEQRPNNTCTTKISDSTLLPFYHSTNGSGLWLFTHDPTPAVSVVDNMLKVLEGMRIYTGDLKTVPHEGCTYAGATLKPTNSQ